MDKNNILFIGGITLALALSLYLLWGPFPTPKKKKRGGIVGLKNLGSTCFLNTLLQALSSCALFVEWLDGHISSDDNFTNTLQKVLWILNGKYEYAVHSPEDILKSLRKSGWVLPAGQQDAHELFDCMISTLEKENLVPPKASSLSDALPPSDTLSQASDILEDPFESLEMDKAPLKTESQSPESGSDPASGDQSVYEDASRGNDSDQFYSVVASDFEDDISQTLKLESPKKTIDPLVIKSGVANRSGASPPINTSPIPPFTGSISSSVLCSSCNHVKNSITSPFHTIHLSLDEVPTVARYSLVELIRKYLRTIISPPSLCEGCKNESSAFVSFCFQKLPPCLCFHIGRTTWHSTSQTAGKRDDHVAFPEFLVMDPFLTRPGAAPQIVPLASTAKYLYRLKSVVVHVGNEASGHFLTFRRGPVSTNERHRLDGKLRRFVDSSSWYVTSDEFVELSTLSEAMDSLAYVLFYERCSPDIQKYLLGEVAIVEPNDIQ